MKAAPFFLAVSAVAAFQNTTQLKLHAAETKSNPVLLYSRYYNAEGENRYLPDGAFKQVIQRLRGDFDVRVHNKPLTPETLAGVKLLLITNPSDKAVGGHPAPPHVSAADINVLTEYVRKGGGLIVTGNQENHNFETTDVNRLLTRFGIQFTNLYTDAKKLVLPKETPIIGGLRWAYYTGDLLLLDPDNPAKPRSLVSNDLNQKPEKGARDEPGCLLAAAGLGKGRVIAVTDSGWLADWVRRRGRWRCCDQKARTTGKSFTVWPAGRRICPTARSDDVRLKQHFPGSSSIRMSSLAWQLLAENRIQEAFDHGEFDDLPGKGVPLDLSDYFSAPTGDRAAFALLKSADVLPPELQLLQEAESLERALKICQDEQTHAGLQREIQARRTAVSMALERRRKSSRADSSLDAPLV